MNHYQLAYKGTHSELPGISFLSLCAGEPVTVRASLTVWLSQKSTEQDGYLDESRGSEVNVIGCYIPKLLKIATFLKKTTGPYQSTILVICTQKATLRYIKIKIAWKLNLLHKCHCCFQGCCALLGLVGNCDNARDSRNATYIHIGHCPCVNRSLINHYFPLSSMINHG